MNIDAMRWFKAEDGNVTGCDGGVYLAFNLHLPSTTCLNNPPHNIPLITILKTLAKRFILVMSRHRFVRNLDLDGE
jgi:hypothetical protein